MNSYNSGGIMTFQLPTFINAGASGTVTLFSEGTDGLSLSNNVSTRLLIMSYNGVNVQSQSLVYMQSPAGGYVYTAAWRVVNLQARLWVYYESTKGFDRVVATNATYSAVGAKSTQGAVTVAGPRAGHVHEIRIYPYAVTEANLLQAAKAMDDLYSTLPTNIHRIRVYRSWTGAWNWSTQQLNISGITAFDANNVALSFVGGSVKWVYQTLGYDWHRLVDGNATSFAISEGAPSTNGTLMESWNEVWVEGRAFTKITVHNRTDNNLQSRIVGCRLQVLRKNATTWEDITVFDSTSVANVYNFTVNIS
jgi:hypothetical protein